MVIHNSFILLINALEIIYKEELVLLLQVKLWDLSNNEPSCVASTNPKAVSNTIAVVKLYNTACWRLLTIILLRLNCCRELCFRFPSQKIAPF